MKVICIHIGARAHYLLPKALECKKRLSVLVTDTWVGSALLRAVLTILPIRLIKSFSNRYSIEIPNHKVKSFSLRFLVAEIYLRLKHKSDWSLIIARNNFFQKQAMHVLRRQSPEHAVLGISYTSLEVFKKAKERGQKTILFQIDPGIKEEEIVSEITDTYKESFPSNWLAAPSYYWSNWKKECMLSDVIMVNSEWSRNALIEHGIEAGKIKTVPLPYQTRSEHFNFKRSYPESFTKERPLNCLFLGTLTLRKGIHLVLESAKKLVEFPVQFILVGNNELDQKTLDLPNVSYKGNVTRAETDDFYKNADVFLFPTLSDGFGLTQLEAMAWKLPVIASTCCGEIVEHLENGVILEACTVGHLTKAILKCLNNPELLNSMSSNCFNTAKNNNVDVFGDRLLSLVERIDKSVVE